jgi:nucleoside-triphosphatase
VTAKNILITGRPRVGKTTLVLKLAALLGERAGGFTTEEIRKEGKRCGFRITSLDGREGILAHEEIGSRFTLGRYGIDIEAMDRIGTDSVKRAIKEKDWVVVDEIGKMEEYSKAFKEAMLAALDSPKRVLATIRQHDSLYTSSIKSRPDVEIIRLTVPGREETYKRIVEVHLK